MSFAKVRKVILSCKTLAHIRAAEKYMNLYFQRTDVRDWRLRSCQRSFLLAELAYRQEAITDEERFIYYHR